MHFYLMLWVVSLRIDNTKINIKMNTIEIREAESVPICGDGCCHDDGLMIDILIDGKFEEDFFYNTESKLETERVVGLMEDLYGEDNVKFTALKK